MHGRVVMLLVAAGLGLCYWAGAAEASQEPPNSSTEPYRISHWTAEDGLPQSTINTLVQTRDGYLWLGTLHGLARFDGVSFKIFDRDNTPALTHDAINDLAEDRKEDGLWIGSGSGLLYYWNHSFQRFGPEQGVPGTAGNLYPARDGGVWFSPGLGQVALARAGRVRIWEFGTHTWENVVLQLAEEGPDQVLVLVGDGHHLRRFRLNPGSSTAIASPVMKEGQPVRCAYFYQAPEGSLWVCEQQELWRLQDGAWQRQRLPGQTGMQWFFRTHDDQLWLALSQNHGNRLYRLVGNSTDPFNGPDFPANLNVTRMLEDREGNLWVGSTTGLFRLEPKRLRVYSELNGLRNEDVQGVTVGSDGTIWLGTSEGLSQITAGRVLNLPLPEGVPSHKITTFLVDSRDRLWIDGGDRLRVFAQGQWQESRPPVPNVGKMGGVQSFYQDRQQRIWVGTKEGVLYQDAGGWSYFGTNCGLSCLDVRVMREDRRGDMWFGTYGGGLNRLHAGRFTAYTTPRGQFNNCAWWIHEDADGVFWVGTEDGLNRFVPPGLAPLPALHAPSAPPAPPGPFFTFTTQHGLRENVINNIQEDEFGFLWLSGLRGIYRVARNELNAVAAGRQRQVECLAYGEADGMLNSECNSGDNQPGGCRDPEGRIWFPTMQGVVVIDPKQIHRNRVPPPVVIEQVVADGEVIYGDGQIEGPAGSLASASRKSQHRNYRLAPGRARTLEIHYTGNSLTAPEKVRFRYRLKGHDRDWHEAGERRVASYTNLRPDSYCFEVLAANPHGVWSEQPDVFAFTLAPHLWETWPFYLSSGGLVLLLGLGVHHQRLREVRRVQGLEQQRALQEERARIARDLHDQLGSDLTRIALEGELAARSCQQCPGAATSAVLPGSVFTSNSETEGQSDASVVNAGRMQALSVSVRAAFRSLDEMIWVVNPKQDTVAGLASYLCQFATSYLRPAGLRCRLDVPSDLPARPLSAGMRHELFLVIKEALHNIVKHAGAREVHLRVRATEDQMTLELSDDGCGFQPVAAEITSKAPDPRGLALRASNGLTNMRERVQAIGGQQEIVTAPGQGTCLRITVPLNGESKQ